jgi:type II secretory pathway component GspD/PulD (secretin)
MIVEPEFSVQTGNVTFSTSDLSYPQPIVATRTAKTTLLVDSGQTVVLGGLRKKDVNKTVNKVPLLGDIPLICYLFRFEGEDTVNSEMLVFITPKIVTDSSLSDLEKKQYEVTEFPGPAIEQTRAEKDAKAGKSDK